MTILELKELLKPLSEADKQELKKILDEKPERDILYNLDELTHGLAVPDSVPTDFAENHHRYIRGQVISDG